MVNKTTSFKKKGKGKKGNFKRNGKQVSTPVKKPKARHNPKTECFYCKGNGHWRQNCPKYLADKKDDKVNKGIFDIHVIDVYLTGTVGGWIRHMPKDGLSWWERVERRRCLEAG